MNRIAALHEEQRSTLLKLNKSLAIQRIWPDAFKLGSCMIKIGTVTGHEWDLFLKGRKEIDSGYIFRIGDGERFPLTPEQFRTLHFMPNGKEQGK
jgi:hypothetical protein